MTRLENLKILHEYVKRYFEEATFTRQARITDKAFRFLTLYTFALAVIPSYVKTQVDFASAVADTEHGALWISLAGAASLAALTLFGVALVTMLRVVHIREREQFDFSELVETVWRTTDLPQDVLLYTLSKNLLDASNQNLLVDDSRSSRMKRSYTRFYYAVGVGWVTFLVTRIYLYVHHA